MSKSQNQRYRSWKARASLMDYPSTIRLDGKELTLAQIINKNKEDILVSWANAMQFMTLVQFGEKAKAFLNAFVDVISSHKYGYIPEQDFEGLLSFLRKISGEGAKQGFSSSYIANFIFSMKHVLTDLMQNYFKDSKELDDEITAVHRLLDALGSYSFETYSKTREDNIREQKIAISLLHKNSLLSHSTKEKENFSGLLLEAIDEALSSLCGSPQTAIYYHLERAFNIKKPEIPKRIDDFSSALEKIFGLGARCIEILIMEKLHEKVGSFYNWDGPKWLVPDFTFGKYVKHMQLYYGDTGKINEVEVLVDATKNKTVIARLSALQGHRANFEENSVETK